MKFSEKWLREFVNPKLSTNELCEQLTLAGLEVDAIEDVAGEFSKVIIGQIITIDDHPNADKLHICQVKVGAEENLNIVCGASNIYIGMKVPVALIGAILPGDFKIKESKLRGEPSFGMMCSAKELGLGEGQVGLLDLPKNAPIGLEIKEYLKLDDKSIDVDLTPNRADCLSVFGIARETAALTKTDLLHLDIKPALVIHNETLPVTIEAESDCQRYLGRIIKNIDQSKPTPIWMQEKLRRSGLRSISAVVDVANYILLELGQPMHAFDLAKVDSEIIIRKAKSGEQLKLLDESEINLDNDTLVIADKNKPIALAGIMGGLDSAIDSETKDVFLESAYFCPIAIAGKARQYGLHTDSSHRYERGVDPKLASIAIERATNLLLDILGGEAGEIIEINSPYLKKDENKIQLRANRLNSILGCNFDNKYIYDTLIGLGLKLEDQTSGIWNVLVPSYRFDLTIEEDLIEEIARVYGYANLPETKPTLTISKVDVSETNISLDNMKSTFVERGFHEVINYSFIDPKLDQFFYAGSGIKLLNPIASDMSIMRQGMLAGLLASSFKTNINRQQDRIRIFEEGVCFSLNNGKTIEKVKLAGVVFGHEWPINWLGNKDADFYSLKSDIEALLGKTAFKYDWQVLSDCEYLHPGQSAKIMLAGKQIGFIGVLHPHALKFLQIKGKSPVVFELDWDEIKQAKMAKFIPISKYPSISRDLAIIVNNDISSDFLLDCVRESATDLLQDVVVFDVYKGEKLEKNKKSVALNLILQSSSQTLKEETVLDIICKVVNNLQEKADAILRE